MSQATAAFLQAFQITPGDHVEFFERNTTPPRLLCQGTVKRVVEDDPTVLWRDKLAVYVTDQQQPSVVRRFELAVNVKEATHDDCVAVCYKLKFGIDKKPWDSSMLGRLHVTRVSAPL